MRKSPPEYRPALTLVTACIAIACHPTFREASMRRHPSALVGHWVDSVQTSRSDTALWLLDASGNNAVQHLRLESDGDHQAPGAAKFLTAGAQHVGHWYFLGTLQDTSGRAICFTRRVRPVAPKCVPFELDSAATPTGMRRRLVVRRYETGHDTSDRVLLARLP
jgi:hypothetical protein